MARRSTRRTGVIGARVADARHAAPDDGDGSPAGRGAAGHTPDAPGTPDVVDLADRNVAATEHLAGGRLSAAVIALESLVYDCRLVLGGEHPETLVVEGNLAVAYVMAGQPEAGVQAMSANLAVRERVFGDLHPRTLTARDALATTYRLAGRLSDAMWLYSRVAPQRNEALGPSHPDTLTTRLGLGLTFAEAGDAAMAHDVFTAALEDCRQPGADGRHAAILRSCLSELRDAAAAPETDPAAAAPPAGETTVPQQRSGPTATDGTPGPRHDRGPGPTADIEPVERAMT